MKQCSKCRMKIENRLAKCPLCGETLETLDNEFVQEFSRRRSMRWYMLVVKIIFFIEVVVVTAMLLINELTEKEVMVLNSHCHFDHIGGVKEMKELTQAPIYIHEADIELYYKIDVQCREFRVPIIKDLPQIDVKMKENDVIDLDGHIGKLIHTPGHSPGSSCLYFEKEHLLINGDTLFRGSYGRSDLWNGNYQTLKNSIKNKLFNLPPETVVITGHGENTTIGKEKRTNMINRTIPNW